SSPFGQLYRTRVMNRAPKRVMGRPEIRRADQIDEPRVSGNQFVITPFSYEGRGSSRRFSGSNSWRVRNGASKLQAEGSDLLEAFAVSPRRGTSPDRGRYRL